MSTLIKENGEWKTVANLAQSDVIRNPDWSKAVSLTGAQLVAGYTAPEDGIIIMRYTHNSVMSAELTINGVMATAEIIAKSLNDELVSYIVTQLPVGKDDVIKVTSEFTSTGSRDSIRFVPYKYPGASSVRTLDWDNKTLIPLSQTASDSWAVPSDGMLIGMLYPPAHDDLPSGETTIIDFSINGVRCALAEHRRDVFTYSNGVQSPVSEGDILRIDRIDNYTIQRGLYFVPYKQ